jgi:hypothetical protein
VLRLLREAKGKRQEDLAAAFTRVWKEHGKDHGGNKIWDGRWVRRAEYPGQGRPWLTRHQVWCLAEALGCDVREKALLYLASGHLHAADIVVMALGVELPDCGQLYRPTQSSGSSAASSNQAAQPARMARATKQEARQHEIDAMKDSLQALLDLGALEVLRAARKKLLGPDDDADPPAGNS